MRASGTLNYFLDDFLGFLANLAGFFIVFAGLTRAFAGFAATAAVFVFLPRLRLARISARPTGR